MTLSGAEIIGIIGALVTLVNTVGNILIKLSVNKVVDAQAVAHDERQGQSVKLERIEDRVNGTTVALAEHAKVVQAALLTATAAQGVAEGKLQGAIQEQARTTPTP